MCKVFTVRNIVYKNIILRDKSHRLHDILQYTGTPVYSYTYVINTQKSRIFKVSALLVPNLIPAFLRGGRVRPPLRLGSHHFSNIILWTCENFPASIR